MTAVMILLIIPTIFLGMTKMMSKIVLAFPIKFLGSPASGATSTSSVFDLGLRSLTVGDSKSKSSESCAMTAEIMDQVKIMNYAL